MQLIACPVVRAPRRDRVPLRRPGPRAPTRTTRQALTDERVGRVPVLPRQHQGSFAERWVHTAGCRRWFNASATPSPTSSWPSTALGEPKPAPHERARQERRRSAAPGCARRTHRPHAPALHLRRPRRTPATPATPSPRPCWPTAGTGGHQHQAGPAPRHHGRRGRGTQRPGPDRGPVPRADAPRHHRLPVRRPGADTASPGWAGWTRAGPRPLRQHTSTPTSSSLAPAPPASPPRATPPAPAPGSCCSTTSPNRAGRCSAPPSASTAARPGMGGQRPQPSSPPSPRCRVLHRTTAFGDYDDNFVLALEPHRPPRPPPRRADLSRQRIWHIRAAQVVLATGAHERPLVFANNDRPGIMLASAVRTYLNRYGVLAGRRVVVVHHQRQRLRRWPPTCAPPASRSPPSSTPARRLTGGCAAGECGSRASRSAPGRPSPAPSGVDAAAPRRHRRRATTTASSPSDRASPATCCRSPAAGTPRCTCFSQAGGKLRYDAALGAFVPGTVVRPRTSGRRGRRPGFDAGRLPGRGHRRRWPRPARPPRLRVRRRTVRRR